MHDVVKLYRIGKTRYMVMLLVLLQTYTEFFRLLFLVLPD